MSTNYYEIEHQYYETPVYDTEAEAWKDLMEYLKPKVDDHWVYFRDIPEVNSEYLFDYKKTVYKGYTRFIINPMSLGLNSNTITIPTIGEAECK